MTQRSPARVHAFSFSGGAWTREDASPADASRQALQLGLDPFHGLATSDHLIFAATGFGGLGVDALDPFAGVELPRVRTSVINGPVRVSADQKFAFLVGPSPTQLPTLSVVDIDPASPSFLTERTALVGFATGLVPNTSTGIVALGGSTLYVALVDTNAVFGFAPYTKIVAIDVSNPLAPSVLAETVVTQTLTPASGFGGVPSLRFFDLGGTPYLFLCRRDLVILQAGPAGTLTRVGQVASSRTLAPAGRRFMVDVYATVLAGHRRAFVAADVGGPVTTDAAEELLVIDLDTLADDQTGISVLSSKTLALPGADDFDKVRPSLDGTHLYVLSPGGSGIPAEVARLRSIDITGTVDELSPSVASIVIDGSVQTATGLEVRPALTPVSGGAVASVAVSGAAPANVLINDAPRTLTIGGSGLTGTAHVFVGLDRLAVGAVSDTSVTATSPALLPAGDRPVVVVSAAGGITRFGPGVPGALAVVNSPTFQPPEVVYAMASSEGKVSILHAAAETEVVDSFLAAPSPGRGIVTPDGAILFVSHFTGAKVEAYSLLADPVHGWTFKQKIADLHTGGAPQAMVMKKDGSRLYASTLDGYVAVIDSSARPPVLIDVDANGSTTDSDVDPGLSPGLSRIAVATFDGYGNADTIARSLALSADDQWLYAGRGRSPQIAVVPVNDDNIPASETIFYSIPSLPGLPPPPNSQRVDGLIVRGSRLCFASSLDNPPLLRLFDISGASIVPAATPSLALPAGAATGVRTLALTPDGQFLYSSSRTQGSDPQRSTVHVLDATTSTWVASLGLGTFSDLPSVSPTSKYAYVASAERDVVYTLDARPGPTQHTPIGATGGGVGTGGTAVNPGQATPTGSGVTVEPAPGVEITFPTIGTAGSTTVTSLNATPVTMPEGFAVLNMIGNPVYYEIKTTASFTPPVKVCLTYTDAQLGGADESTLRLMHEEAGVFVDRTIGAPATDPALNRICGEVSSFSQFAIGVRTGSRTLCSVLGRECRPRARDIDVFEFVGVAGEHVELTLAEDPDPINHGDDVRLILHDKIRGRKLVEREHGPLPLSIEATLPASGRYVVKVERKSGRRGFAGHYCLTLQSSANGFTTFAASASVEP